jgi:hypothetical protein
MPGNSKVGQVVWCDRMSNEVGIPDGAGSGHEIIAYLGGGKTPHALADGLMLVFQHPANACRS